MYIISLVGKQKKMKNLLFGILIISSVYSQCNESNWREFYPNMQNCQLSGADLVGADLSYANLSGSDLIGADLSGAGLFAADLSYANLSGANLSWAGFSGAVFDWAYLAGANLTGAILDFAVLPNACLEGVIGFTQTNYMGSPIFEGCNNPPVAQEGTHTQDEDTVTTITLEAYDQEGDALNYMIVSAPTFGTATLSGSMATYIPNANFNGIDSFQFKANDGQFGLGVPSNTATVTLMVSAVNDAPYLYSIDDSTIILGETFSHTLQAEDADGDNLIYTVSVSGGSANANINGNTLTVEPQEANVTLNVVVTATDGNTTYSIAFLIAVFQPQQTCLDNNNDGWCDQFPTMSIMGDSVLLLGLEPGEEYTDDGATCSDNEDGDILSQVEVSGQVVSMSTPGTYEIYYNCSDSDGNAAQTLTRTVVVVPDFISDENQDGFDDDAFMAGSQSGDANMDGSLDVVDIVIFINSILNGEQ